MPMTWAQSLSSKTSSAIPNSPAEGTIRVATYNVSLHRKKLGELAENLQQDDAQAVQLARVIQTVRPDIFLVNEIDYVPEAKTAVLFRDKFLHQYSSFGGSKKPKLEWPFFFAGPVNTGVDSGLDLNQNGKVKDPDDSWGFGYYDGQYGMAVYSRFPIDNDGVRTFQNFRWASMPDAKKPIRKDGKPFWDDEIWEKLRLSSKSHWDIPIEVDGKKLHLLASHPTPPVFDGSEDRNGCRNHDEIRFWTDYISSESQSAYIEDDLGKAGGLKSGEPFVIVGDLNSDPNDGDGQRQGIQELLAHSRIGKLRTPTSRGGELAAMEQAKANKKHQGDAKQDTADFGDDRSGNLRCDFVLPSSNFIVVDCGVFWPTPDECKSLGIDSLDISDHRMVWVDIKFVSAK